MAIAHAYWERLNEDGMVEPAAAVVRDVVVGLFRVLTLLLHR